MVDHILCLLFGFKLYFLNLSASHFIHFISLSQEEIQFAQTKEILIILSDRLLEWMIQNLSSQKLRFHVKLLIRILRQIGNGLRWHVIQTNILFIVVALLITNLFL